MKRGEREISKSSKKTLRSLEIDEIYFYRIETKCEVDFSRVWVCDRTDRGLHALGRHRVVRRLDRLGNHRGRRHDRLFLHTGVDHQLVGLHSLHGLDIRPYRHIRLLHGHSRRNLHDLRRHGHGNHRVHDHLFKKRMKEGLVKER